jgi:energy-coupling factor transporter ATP-binding protein EcfA2
MSELDQASAVPQAAPRLPTEPYPGLRPYLPFEAPLLFGREPQVREVIERLRSTQFVAVIGGSGSGKSSLVHAGVMPELRSFAIPGAGDFWIPMVCTPGTNALAGQTPITRLAWKFAKLLKPRATAAENDARRDEIAAVFRQESGFARLLETYARELDVPSGMRPQDARLLFVVDQFEELFHPTNRGETDGRLLVERIIDHFFAPGPQCFVVLTMRSEHLNDCAGILELPDAINRSFYLVRRLDEAALRDAIVMPAQRFLRLEQRRTRGTVELPSEVRFDDAVVARLLKDVGTISGDPDHLPLLQHLLARLWESARGRAGPSGMPALIDTEDFRHAVTAVTGPGAAIDDHCNVLRESLENWGEATFLRRGGAARSELDKSRLELTLRQLAYKDPNTGMYTQQRINVDECARFLGAGCTRDDLHALVADGFLGGVDYLFWDREDPRRVTLKVSHESFIRGWKRFRRLVDEEAERFEEFRAILRRCEDWVSADEIDERLLERGELRRLREHRLEPVFDDPTEREDWFRVLLLDREGARLAGMESRVVAFLAGSRDREQLDRKARLRRLQLAVLTAVAVLLLLPPIAFSFFVQGPVITRADRFFDASNLANQLQVSGSFPKVGAAANVLDPLMCAAELIERDRSPARGAMGNISQFVLDHGNWLPPVRRLDRFLTRAGLQAEPLVNGQLRELLARSLWIGAPAETTGRSIQMAVETPALCGMTDSAGRVSLRPGRLFTEAVALPGAMPRALFVPNPDAGSERDLLVAQAVLPLGPGGPCTVVQRVESPPLERNPAIVFDASLRHLMRSTQGLYGSEASVTLSEIRWDLREGGSWDARAVERTVITDPAAVALVEAAAGHLRVSAAPTRRDQGGRIFEMAGTPWRVFSSSALRLDDAGVDQRLEPLQPASAAPACQLLGARLGERPQPGFRSDFFTDGAFCFEIKRGLPMGVALQGTTTRPLEDVVVAAYDMPRRDDLEAGEQLPPPIAVVRQFGRVAADQQEWFVGRAGGRYEGWIAVRSRNRRDELRFAGVPWSTGALLALGRSLGAQNPVELASQGRWRPSDCRADRQP